MFDVDGMHITMTAGDTGAFVMHFSGYEFTQDDVVLFTIKTGSGGVVIEREYQPDANGDVLVCFFNSETEGYGAGNYLWDIRIVIHAYRDENGRVTNGDQVITPYEPQQFTLISAVGTV